MLPKLIDNSRFSLQSIIEKLCPAHKRLSIATGYWDILGTQLIFDSIKSYKSVRLLIGRPPPLPRHKRDAPEPDYPDQDFADDLERLPPSKDLRSLVGRLKRLIRDGVLEVKVYRKEFFHAKSYIFGDYDSDGAVGIVGSSNFTKSGLTLNTELNALENDHRIVVFRPETQEQEIGHLFWFDRFWNSENAVTWNEEFTDILSMSPVGDTLFGPYETYIKTLYELYREELEDEKLENKFASTHDLLDFQVKNAQALLRRLKKYKMAMLADSVGLGKTYTAIEVIKQYLDTNEGRKRVEIICPKSLEEQWQKELAVQKVFNLTPVTLQNIDKIKTKRELDHIANVALFVIDESHNLKNRAGKRFKEIVAWIRDNPKAHVLMLTATPISNQLVDIANQLLLGTGGKADQLMFPYSDKATKQTISLNFHQVIEILQKKIKREIKSENKIDEEHIKEIMNPILRAFVVRRTRQGIEREYGGLKIDGQEQKFPKVEPYVEKYRYKKETSEEIVKQSGIKEIYQIPIGSILNHSKSLVHPLGNIGKMEKEIKPEDIDKKSPVYLMYQIILFLNFIPYKWRTYKKQYYGKTREQLRELGLDTEKSRGLFQQISIYGILRTMFLKRIESSIYAFEQSLIIYERKLGVFEQGLRAGKIVSVKNFEALESRLGEDDIDPEDLEELEEEVLDDDVTAQTYELDILHEDIKKEQSLISLLKDKIVIFKEDNAKLESFVKIIKNIDPGKKVLVFSYYADTIDFLEKSIFDLDSPISKENSGFLSSRNRNKAENFACRFSPKSKKYELKQGEREITYLFSTDILSEGQNLQDCGIVINYDLHWSPVRMIQRNGRINRLGTPFDKVCVYNIAPEEQLEEYLRLVHRLQAKIKLIKSTIGTDTPVLDEDENPLEFTDSIKDIYSDDLQKRIQAMNKSEHDADFLLAEDEYISDLKIFHNDDSSTEHYKKSIYGIPAGKWSLMPKSDFRGSARNPRPDILALNSLFDEGGRFLGHAFIVADTNGEGVEFAPNLQALEWLRTRVEEINRTQDRMTLDKGKVKEVIHQRAKQYTNQRETALMPQQQEVLRILHKHGFDQEAIEATREFLATTNVLDQQEIRSLSRKIVQADNKGKADTESLRILSSMAQRSIDEQITPIKVHSSKQILFYVKDNK